MNELDNEVTLLDLLDRLLNKGIVIKGDLTVSVANVDLLYIGLNVIVTSIETLNQTYNKRVEGNV
ncbi:MAG: gas vesicle protein GvpJ [Bacillus sp. (in: firmicutes)]